MHHRSKVFALIFLGMTSVVSAQSLDDLLATGQAQYEAHDYEATLQTYTEARALAGQNYTVLLGLARVQNDLGEELKDTDKKRAEALFSAAIETTDRLAEGWPDDAEVHFMRAASKGNLALFKGGRDKVKLGRDIRVHLERALELDPQHALAHAVLGVYNREIASLNWFERGFAKVFYGGVPEGSKEEAVRLLQQAHALDATLIYPAYELARTLHDLDRTAEAIPLMEQLRTRPAINRRDERMQESAMYFLQEWQK